MPAGKGGKTSEVPAGKVTKPSEVPAAKVKTNETPVGKTVKADERRGSNSAKRETFRPPWVKDDPDGLPPKPSNLWSKTRRTSKDGADVPEGSTKNAATVKTNEPQENGTKEHIFVKPQLKPVPPKEATQTKLQSREIKVPIKLNSVKRNKSIEEVEKPPEKNPIIRQDSLKKVSNIPKAPPIPPPAPQLPRPSDLKPLSTKQKDQIDNLKNRPKVRPDWTSLLKEVESGKKLKHVQCNDRSQPVIPKAKDTEKKAFIYESEKKEKNTAHNQLLEEIQHGVSLKKTKTNDRSKPQLEGLRKFRRQMTIEEQIIKSQSMASIPPEEIPNEVDELDDIDKVRDDLQSTKQMLAMELRNKEALARENKRIAARLAQLEAELDKERSGKKPTPVGPVETDEKLVKSLKTEAADARKTAEDLEKKYKDASHQLCHTKTELEEVRKQKQQLERKLIDSLQVPALDKRLSISDRQDSVIRSESDKEGSDSDLDGSDEEAKKEKKAQREIKQLRNKLRTNKNKEDNAKKERTALKTQIKRMQQAIKDEKKKYKALKKEVSKMAALMKDTSDDDEDEEKEPEEEEEQPTTESESESESSETESESEKSVSEAEDAPFDKKKANVVKRTKKHESRLSALKKGNYILKTNVERLQDDLNKQKELTIDLQQDLDSVLSELG